MRWRWRLLGAAAPGSSGPAVVLWAASTPVRVNLITDQSDVAAKITFISGATTNANGIRPLPTPKAPFIREHRRPQAFQSGRGRRPRDPSDQAGWMGRNWITLNSLGEVGGEREG